MPSGSPAGDDLQRRGWYEHRPQNRRRLHRRQDADAPPDLEQLAITLGGPVKIDGAGRGTGDDPWGAYRGGLLHLAPGFIKGGPIYSSPSASNQPPM